MRLGKVRLTLAVLVVAELLAALCLWLPRQRIPAPGVERPIVPEIEERHFLTVRVLDPSGRVIEGTFETRSFVWSFVLAARMASPWRMVYLTRESFFEPLISQSSLRVMRFHYLYANGTPVSALAEYAYPAAPSYRTFFSDGINTYYGDRLTPAVVVLGSGSSPDGGSHLGSPLGVSAVPSVSYGYNDLWFNLTVTATFSFSQDATVSEAALLVYAMRSDSTEGGAPYYVTLVYDSFPAVSVPAGGSLTVQWVFAWKDYGAFTENWGRLWQYALLSTVTYEWFPWQSQAAMSFVNASGLWCSTTFPPLSESALPAGLLELAWGAGTSPMSRSFYRLERETGAGTVSISFFGGGIGGFALGGGVGPGTEIGLYWRAMNYTGQECRVLLMRWVPGYTVPAGTPINIYVARGG
jgi:hypothetical protein